MAGGINRKEVLNAMVTLAEGHYDTITNLMNMTLQEISDIYKVLISNQQERELKNSRGKSNIKGY